VAVVVGLLKAIKQSKKIDSVVQELQHLTGRIERSTALDDLSKELNHRLDSILLEKERELERLYHHIDELSKESKSALNYNVEELHRKLREVEEHSHRRMDDILSQLDSRLDKLETRLKTYVDNHATMMKVALETHKITLKD
jgi:division protein CdvB (Snf7/Vps24/ESCRT-III family)